MGYKAHIAEDESEIVTSCEPLKGNQNEGKELKDLLKKEIELGMKHEAIAGDALYGSQANQEVIEEKKTKAYFPREVQTDVEDSISITIL